MKHRAFATVLVLVLLGLAAPSLAQSPGAAESSAPAPTAAPAAPGPAAQA